VTRAGAGRPLRIGITGPIGCGKSTIADWLAELGAVVIDADEIARAVLEPGEVAREAVIAAYGPAVRDGSGGLDRAALASIVFADPAALQRLESIVHPAVRTRILDRIAAADASGAPAVVVEAIKLIEGGLAELCDEVWLIDCDPEVQRGRLAARGMDADDATARIAAQAGLAERVRTRATRVITTDDIPARTRQRVMRVWRGAVRRVAKEPPGPRGGPGGREARRVSGA
jgi:dephospho-CoA kinase